MSGVAHDGYSSRLVRHALAGGEIVSRKERVLVPVVLDDDPIAKDHGRAGGSPLVARIVDEADIHHAEIGPPLEIPVHVETEQAFAAHQRNDDLSVGGRVAEAWLAFTCRFIRGTPWWTARSQTIFPVCLSTAISRHVCGPVSVAESIPDLSTSPVLTAGRPVAATAVVT